MLGWPEHPLQDVPADVVIDGTQDDIHGQFHGQFSLLWDTVVMDWVHGCSSSASRPQFPARALHPDSPHGILSMIDTCTEDVDIGASAVDPSEANEIFRGLGPGPGHCTAPPHGGSQQLLSELWASIAC